MRTATITTAAIAVAMTLGMSAVADAGGCHKRYSSSYSNHVYHAPKRIVYHQPAPIIVHKPAPIIVHRPAPVIVHTPAPACYQPNHCHCYVGAADTLLLIAQRAYGNPAYWTQIAKFNNITSPGQYQVGMQIKLPAIHGDGRMTASTAPAPLVDTATSQLGSGTLPLGPGTGI